MTTFFGQSVFNVRVEEIPGGFIVVGTILGRRGNEITLRLYEIENEEGERSYFWTYKSTLDLYTPAEANELYPKTGDGNYFTAWRKT